MTERLNLAIIGKGAFGSALHRLYQDAGYAPSLYGRDFPAAPEAGIILLAVPTGALREVAARLTLRSGQTVVLCCKGLLPDGDLPSSLFSAHPHTAVLAGPGFAADLSAGLPAVHSLACADGQQAADLARRLSTPSFRLYWSDDPDGVQLCGALKNIFAIAAGMADGLTLGDSARAALITRAASELRRSLAHAGAQADTFWSPAGIGDLVLTCTSDQSRNFRFGKAVATGRAAEEALAETGTVEGYRALPGLLARVPADDVPIASALNDVLRGALSASEALQQLMTRPLPAEDGT